ncbi:MAG: phophatidylserine decarboxylase associated domain-containing protein, partial [Geobacteraceae bacterium]|nr:phophatidylserine decarboxylase associated domain-containing protein [Geobacteraceae bacterium]
MKNKVFVVLAALLSLSFLGLFTGYHAAAEPFEKTAPYRVGKWLPSDKVVFDQWLAGVVAGTESANEPLAPVIRELKELIEGDPQLYMLFNQMFDQVPCKRSFSKDPAGNPQIKNYQQMLQVMNRILTLAPEFNTTGLVGFPINAVLDWPMGTSSRRPGHSRRHNFLLGYRQQLSRHLRSRPSSCPFSSSLLS